jgi:16S rRNA (cytosine1402-N4)-methyltransferase
MRMNQSSSLSAFEVINNYDEKQLRAVLFNYGELRSAPKIARTIVSVRKEGEIATSEKLKEVLKPFLPVGREHKVLAQVYQAIRIEVNQEIEVLKEFLLQTEDLLRPGGRLSLISYHSLEDRLVKRYIRSGMFEGEPEKDFYGNISVPFRKVGKMITPSPEEIKRNNRARSARLRIAERIE